MFIVYASGDNADCWTDVVRSLMQGHSKLPLLVVEFALLVSVRTFSKALVGIWCGHNASILFVFVFCQL